MPVLHSILVATDLTRASDEVVRAAAQLAAHARAALHVVHALEENEPPTHRASALHEASRYAGRALDAHFLRLAPGAALPDSLHVEPGAAHLAILERAVQVSADLIVLGPHRGGALGARLLGTTAERVLRRARVPCLIVRGPLVLPLSRIGVPDDVAGARFGALDLALRWMASLGEHQAHSGTPVREVMVLHVAPPARREEDASYEHRRLSPMLDNRIQASIRRTGLPLWTAVRSGVVWSNTAGEAIARWAELHSIELIVLRTRRPGRLQRALLGSTAAFVARHAPCPVLLLPPTRARIGTTLEPALAGTLPHAPSD